MDSKPSWMKEDPTRERSEWTRERGAASSVPATKATSSTTSATKTSSSASVPRHIREMGKRLKAIYEDEGLDFGPDPVDEDTVIDRFKVATRLRKNHLEEVLKCIRRARDVQLCFLVDVTGSMQPHIDGVRKYIDEIVKVLTDDGGSAHVTFADAPKKKAEVRSLQVAFVAYRDHGDSNQFEVLPFTGTAEFKAFSGRLRASGGGDGPEDVFGGLDTALGLAWSDNCGTKTIFHICDAPCHGREFHTMHDDHPAGDPKGRTHVQLFRRLRELGVQYHFGKINPSTATMMKKFAEAYGEPIVEFDVKDAARIKDAVVDSVRESISASIAASRRAGGGAAARTERVFTLDKAEPAWAELKELKGTFISYEFPKSIRDIKDDVPLERNKPKSALVKVAPNPFGKGAERIAFYGKDVSTYAVKSGSKEKEVKVHKKDESIVLKEYLHEGKGMNSAKRYELSNQMQTVAAFLAQKFVGELKGSGRALKFLKIRTVCLETPLRFMSCERRFGPEVKFVRFTNNADYHIMEKRAMELGVKMEYVQLVTAFSHWTYKASEGFLMVVDLEGVVGRIESDGKEGVLLTDPAIHCEDVTRYGPMNHGRGGMKTFFERHECNQFCRELGLVGVHC